MTIAALFACLSLVSDVGVGAEITYETRAVRASEALAEISRQAGVSLRTSQQTADEVVVMRLNGVPLREAMDRIAEATCAEWNEEAGGFRLIRSAKMQKEQEKAHRDMRIENIRKVQKKLAETLTKQGPFDEARAKGFAEHIRFLQESQKGHWVGSESGGFTAQIRAGMETPGTRLCMALFCGLNPALLAQVKRGAQADFAINPKKMQYPLPANAPDLVRAFEKELEVFRGQVSKLGSSEDRLFLPLEGLIELASKPPGKVRPLLSLSRLGSFETSSIDFHLVDELGRIADRGVILFSFDEPYLGADDPPPMAEVRRQEDKPIPLSPLSVEVARLTKAQEGVGPYPAHSPELLAFLLAPTKNEIGALAASDFLLGLASQRGANMVACLTDSFAMRCLRRIGSEVVFPRQIEALLKEEGTNVELIVEGGWIVGRPKDPFEHRAVRCDRKDVETFAHAFVATGRVGLNNIAGFALKHPSPESGEFLERYLLLLASESVSTGVETLNWDLLQLHGMFTREDRQTLLSGKSVPIGRMTQDQLALVNRCVFSQSGVYAEPKDPKLRHEGQEDDDSVHDMIWYSMPSEAYPQGLPPGTLLRVETESETLVGASALWYGSRTLTERSLTKMAEALLAVELGQLEENDPRDLRDFWYSEKISYRYTFDAGRPFHHVGSLSEVGPRSTKVASANLLPAEIWAALKREMDLLRAKRPPSRLLSR